MTAPAPELEFAQNAKGEWVQIKPLCAQLRSIRSALDIALVTSVATVWATWDMWRHGVEVPSLIGACALGGTIAAGFIILAALRVRRHFRDHHGI